MKETEDAPVQRNDNPDGNPERKIKRLEKDKDRLKKKVTDLEEENRRLKEQVAEYRALLFKSNRNTASEKDAKPGRIPKKRGAPKGHPGTTRKTPDRVDEHVDVFLEECPECGGHDLKECKRHEDHYQEDIVIPQTKVTRFRHHFYYCSKCKTVVYGQGEGEMPGSYIGPVAKGIAGWLHYQMRIPYRQIRRLFHELFRLDFDPSSAPGFDRQIRCRGDPFYEQLKKLLPEQAFAHLDETGWRKEGVNYWLWCCAVMKAVVFLIDRRRSGEVVTNLLGKKYGGVLISDFLATYNGIICRKQRCLVHLLRLIKKWQIRFAGDKKRKAYFVEFKKLIKSIIAFSKKMAAKAGLTPADIVRRADLIARLRRKLAQPLHHPRADKFRIKLLKMIKELTTCLDFPDVCAHNNRVERLLRGSVIMRKVTFGNRSDNGIRNHEVIMSLIETAKLHSADPLRFLHLLLTNPTQAASVILPNKLSPG